MVTPSPSLEKQTQSLYSNSFETVKKIHVTLDPFTPENGLLTPTLKIRRSDSIILSRPKISADTSFILLHRRDAQAKYKDILADLYSKPESEGTKL